MRLQRARGVRHGPDDRRTIPAHLRGWLLDPRSLSRRLARAAGGSFRVSVVAQRWQRPAPAERRALRLSRGQHALVREVLLECRGRPWVFARSVIPRAALGGERRRLAHVGPRPLGEVLFALPGVRRATMRVRPAGADRHTLARCAAAIGHTPMHVWQRTSVFRLRDRTLLVNELFLEDFARG